MILYRIFELEKPDSSDLQILHNNSCALHQKPVLCLKFSVLIFELKSKCQFKSDKSIIFYRQK